MELVFMIPLAGLAAVFFAAYLAWDVLRRDPGTPEMQEVAGMIFEGAMAFLRRQYSTIAIFALITAVAITIIVGAVSEGEAYKCAHGLLLNAEVGSQRRDLGRLASPHAQPGLGTPPEREQLLNQRLKPFGRRSLLVENFRVGWRCDLRDARAAGWYQVGHSGEVPVDGSRRDIRPPCDVVVCGGDDALLAVELDDRFGYPFARFFNGLSPFR